MPGFYRVPEIEMLLNVKKREFLNQKVYKPPKKYK